MACQLSWWIYIAILKSPVSFRMNLPSSTEEKLQGHALVEREMDKESGEQR